MKSILCLFLFLISFPFLSRVFGYLTKIEHPQFLIKKVISIYASHYDIDMQCYKGNLNDYKSLSAFFIRPLNPLKRPLNKVAGSFLSPSDGKITAIEKINTDNTFLVKGKSYKVSEMLSDSLDFSKNWYVMTIYLSPRDYHRYHAPADVSVDSFYHTGARLYPVNNLSVNAIDNLFIKNERVIVKMKSNSYQFYYVAVGATFVGSIKMDFASVMPENSWTKVDKPLSQMDEVGRFEMGSTIVLVIPEKMVDEFKVKEGSVIQTGNVLFTMNQGA